MNLSSYAPWTLSAGLVVCVSMIGCGGSSDSPPATEPTAQPATPGAPVGNAGGKVILKPPVLSFTDTGVNVNDSITFNGIWSVTNDSMPWEYSLDQGRTWIRGSGDFFEVKGDGPRMIWVRSVDEEGNTSEIVMVSCVLDTKPPDAVGVSPVADGATRILQISGLESGGRWEYSLDNQRTWRQGLGSSVGVLGNGLRTLWLRQLDIAGNVSVPQAFALETPGAPIWHEASANPLQPSVLNTMGTTRIFLIHGSVVRNDPDYVRWDIPAGYRLQAVRLVSYESDDNIAFYAIQRSAVFDAGVDVSRMLVYGHMGPQDLSRNVVAAVADDQLGAGSMTLWFQQTGTLQTTYAFEIALQPVQ